MLKFITLSCALFSICQNSNCVSSKSMKKLSKSEVDVKAYVFPCSVNIEEEKFLNMSSGSKQNHLRNCKRKLVIRMTVNSGGEHCTKSDGFIPIDHIIDGVNGRKKRLLNPLMIRIKREKMYQLYDLQLVKAVNAEAKEEVINYENRSNFTGCDTSSSHPTCGFTYFNNKMIQFSEGFCCSCDQAKNDQRQPCEGRPGEGKLSSQLTQYSLNRHHRSNRSSRDLESSLEPSFGNPSIVEDTEVLENENFIPFDSREDTNIVEDGNKEKSSVNFNKESVGKYFSDMYLPRGEGVSNESEYKPRGSESILKEESKQSVSVLKEDLDKNKFESLENKNLMVRKDNYEMPPSEDTAVIESNNGAVLSKFSNELLPSTEENLRGKGTKQSLLLDTKDGKKIEGDNNKGSLEYYLKNNELKKGNPVFQNHGLKFVNRDESDENFDDVDQNVTVKVFQFEHSYKPQDEPYTVSSIDFAVESKDDGDSSGQNERYSMKSKTSEGVSKEKLRLLLMNKIKLDKNDEKVQDANESCSDPKGWVKNQYKVRSLKSAANNKLKGNSEDISAESCKNFSLKLSNGKSELDIHIVTNKPNRMVVEELKSKSSFLELNSRKQSNQKGFDEQLTSTKGCLKDSVINKLKQQTFTTKVTAPSVTCKTTTEYCKNSTIDKDKNDTDSLRAIESVVYKLVPIINSAKSSCDRGKTEKTDAVLKDQENKTHKMYIELKKKDDISPCTNTSVSFNLSNVKISNGTIPLPDYRVLKSKTSPSDELTQNFQTEVKSQILESTNRDAETHQVVRDQKREIEKREASDKQIRGGQSCCTEGKTVPCFADRETYFESAHCLRFSDLWYNVHKLVSPRLENSITLKIYAKHKTCDKRVCWENLTKRMPGKIGTSNQVAMDDSKNIMITYSSDDKVAFSLDCTSDYLLVPQPLTKRCKDSELKSVSHGGPQEYLVLKENEISFDGEDCDKAGVTYSTFARQPHRCQREAGSCLKNQPLHFWHEDTKAAAEGRQGQYFLSNFVTVPEQAILQNTTSNQVVLRAPYTKSYQSHIVVELNADNIDIIADRSEGQITEVYIDATSDKVTIVKAVISNLGIAADLFGVDFANCSSPLGPSDFDKPGKDEIPPQHRITYTATISSPNLHKYTECKLALYNIDQELVASRHIIILRGQRCMCVWHCQCVCYNYPRPGLLCTPLSLRDYNQAGFPGHLPVTTTSECGIFFNVLQGLLWFFIFLLLFGLLKAILGLCIRGVAVFGLWYLLTDEAMSLVCYMEPSLAGYPVVRDCEGFPIHPKSFKRNVHFIPWYSEFPVNVFFFICVLRTCLCEFVCQRVGVRFSNHQYHSMDQRGRRGSPCCGGSPGPRSPCGSPCSNRKRFRLHAGGEEQLLQHTEDDMAKRRVDELVRSYIVFRNLTRPLGGVKSVPGTPYCVKGFFMQSDNGVYQFTPPSPLIQVWQMDGNVMDPPVPLDPVPFHALYRSPMEVLATRELSRQPHGVVINVS